MSPQDIPDSKGDALLAGQNITAKPYDFFCSRHGQRIRTFRQCMPYLAQPFKLKIRASTYLHPGISKFHKVNQPLCRFRNITKQCSLPFFIGHCTCLQVNVHNFCGQLVGIFNYEASLFKNGVATTISIIFTIHLGDHDAVNANNMRNKPIVNYIEQFLASATIMEIITIYSVKLFNEARMNPLVLISLVIIKGVH
ncbi:hypothetical protein MTBSS4_690006 [Magnetospirillum sp. SS-4]|nr:hypothetical protein MTBSS4_690006 [Magnetospirillum sp. SS-4]